MEKQSNPLLCDIATGMCETSGGNMDTATKSIQSTKKSIKAIYFTGPICSSCWGIESQLRKLKLECGNNIEVYLTQSGLGHSQTALVSICCT
ncbi:MAG: DsbA family protein [Lewinella sp.]|nr:DsbA family protein [Lewinella sp.]